jgi:5-methylcytosine-specific restriction endonuclease McrA
MDDLSASHKVHRRKCANCGCRFNGTSKSIYCSQDCMKNFYSIKLKKDAASLHTPVSFTCKECGRDYTTSYGNARTVYCSQQCSRRYIRRVRRRMERAKLRGAKVEVVDPIKVFERDGWRCQICWRKTPRERRGSIKPNAPELDHIVPLSVGGEHSYRNTQCSCRDCNSSKGNKVYGQVPMFAT